MLVAAHLNPHISIDNVIPDELKNISDESIAYILQRIPAIQTTNPNNDIFGIRPINVQQNRFEL